MGIHRFDPPNFLPNILIFFQVLYSSPLRNNKKFGDVYVFQILYWLSNDMKNLGFGAGEVKLINLIVLKLSHVN